MDNSSLRILHLAASERWTGCAEPLTSVAAQQIKMGHTVFVGCCPGYTFEEELRKRKIPIIEGLFLNRRMHPFNTWNDMRLLPRFCRENEIDIVHCHLNHDHWLAASRLKTLQKKQSGRPYIIRTKHTSVPPRNDFLHRWLYLKRTNRLFSVSDANARKAEKVLGIETGTILSTGGGVDMKRFCPENSGKALREKHGVPSGAPLVGMVSHLRAGRGLRWFLNVIPHAIKNVPEAHFIVFGRGEFYKWFKQEHKKDLYQGRLHNGGFIPEHLPDAYAMIDLSVFLGLGSEGTCRAILEAMATARPTIGTNRGAVPEIIIHEKTGLVIRDRSNEELLNALTTMLGDLPKTRQMGIAARQRCEENYSEESRAQRVTKVYLDLVKKGHNSK